MKISNPFAIFHSHGERGGCYMFGVRACTHEAFAGLALVDPLLARAEDDVVQLLVAAGRGRVALRAAGAGRPRAQGGAVALGTPARQHPPRARAALARPAGRHHLLAVSHLQLRAASVQHAACSTHRERAQFQPTLML